MAPATDQPSSPLGLGAFDGFGCTSGFDLDTDATLRVVATCEKDFHAVRISPCVEAPDGVGCGGVIGIFDAVVRAMRCPIEARLSPARRHVPRDASHW
jgi:hypothetical protein